MSRLPIPLSRLVRENFAVIMTFAFSRPPLERLLDEKFAGEWRFLREALTIMPEENAIKACIELAAYLRLLDDQQGLSGYLRATGGFALGRVVKEVGADEPLYLRDMTNKIVHARDLRWDFSDSEAPKLICVSGEPSRWVKAEVELVALAAFCGQLMSA